MNKELNQGGDLAGSRVRERRIAAGMKQADLADKAGISPSYLNLIEHNKRRIGGKLLVTFAQTLGVDPQFLSNGADASLIENLHDASLDRAAQNTLGDEARRIEEFAEKFPGWAQLISVQRERIAQLEGLIDGLNDRLTHDPVLSETMHDVLSTASAIRSTASILVATPDIDAEWRQRFHANIDTESRRLAETSAAMAEHFEHLTQSSATYVTPLQATQALFDAHAHHFPQIEANGADGIALVLDEAAALSTESMRMVRAALQAYASRALVFPMDELTGRLKTQGFSDVIQIATDHGGSLEDLLIRLAELPHDPELPDMGVVQVDGAGALIKRKDLAAFPIPRFGAACNLWPVFATLAAPNHAIKRRVRSSEGANFTTYSIANVAQAPSFDAPPVYRATMLIVADSPDHSEIDIGPACRVCPYQSCDARREPSIVDSLAAS